MEPLIWADCVSASRRSPVPEVIGIKEPRSTLNTLRWDRSRECDLTERQGRFGSLRSVKHLVPRQLPNKHEAYTKGWFNASPRWASIKTTFGECLVFAGKLVDTYAGFALRSTANPPENTQEILTRCWLNVGPASRTMGQQYTSIRSTSRGCNSPHPP